jgi:hypothetical protein
MLIRTSFLLATGAAAGALPAAAAELKLEIDLPRMNVAEYHRPYVAAWLERADQSFVGNVALWYDVKKRDNGGAKWLKELRGWWRASGRAQPSLDGVSGATRPAGAQPLDLLAAKQTAALAPGRYQVVVEAARENGGREVLRIPFDWPAKAPQSLTAAGEGELGGIALEIAP